MDDAATTERPSYILLRTDAETLHVGEIDAWSATCLMASLSVDPRNFRELQQAYGRYGREHGIDRWDWRRGVPTEAELGENWLVIDLARQQLLCGPRFDMLDREGVYQWDDEPRTSVAPKAPVAYMNLPPHWKLEAGTRFVSWRDQPERPLVPRPEVRAILFGRPLVEWLAREVIEGNQRLRRKPRRMKSKELRAREQYKVTQRIHADWLETPREDLLGLSPRPFLHGSDRWIEREMLYRKEEWSRDFRAPPAVERDTYLYQFGGIGPNERMIYFDLCRHLLEYAWDAVVRQPNLEWSDLADILAARRQDWLREPYRWGFETPGQIIEHERQRMPMQSFNTPDDCDCPLCRQLMSDAHGPAFVDFDGFHLDAEERFVFSNCEFQEDWNDYLSEIPYLPEDDDDEDDLGTLGESWDDERPGSDIKRPAAVSGRADPWEHTFVNWKSIGDAQTNPSLFSLGVAFAAAEIIEDLKEEPTAGDLREQLEVACNRLKQALQCHGDEVSASCDVNRILCQISERYPHLAAKATDLRQHLTIACQPF